MKQKRVILIVALMILSAHGKTFAAVVWDDDMSSLNWTESSDIGESEIGPNTGGIQVVGDFVQMNSWWDSSLWTQMWTGTGVIIQDESDYTLTTSMISYVEGGKAVMIKMSNVNQSWADIVTNAPAVSDASYNDYSISFSTTGSANDGLIGDEIGIGISPDWWNNLGITLVSIEATGAAASNDITAPSPDPMTWKTEPYAKSATSISMTATTAIDDLNNVEYYFDCTTDAGFSSSWQTSTTYICDGLTTDTPYTFRVKARDTASTPNETAYSTTASATPTAIAIDYPPILPGTGGDLATTNSTQLTITIDVNDQKQTVEGFGASDCWSAQYIGQWPSAKQNAIADLLFETSLDGNNDPIGAGLSIWRMNMGGGSVRQGNIYDIWRQSDFYYNSALTAYDWTRCPGQRNFLQLAKARGVDHFKAFCNSPPITMTKNGYAFCDTSIGDTNLDPTKRDEFATYLVDVLTFFRDTEGIDFKTISPFNEPEWDWNENPDHAGYAWQEGCRYTNDDMSAFVDVLYPEMQASSLTTHIDVCDSGQLDYLYSQGSSKGDHVYEFFNASSSNYIGDKLPASISSHSYWTDSDSSGLVTKRQSLRSELNSYGLAYEQTEYCILGDYGPTRDLGIDPALYIARTIHFDMTIAEATTWQWWTGISTEDYKDGLVYVDKNTTDGNYYDSKMLWAVGNFARFIRPGMKQVGLTRSDTSPPENNLEGLMVSSYYNPFNDAVVTVFVNRANKNKRVDLNYQNLLPAKPINYVVPYVTSSSDDLTAFAALNVGDTLEIPSKSIVTVVSMHITPGDLEPDGDVDIDDVVIMALQWLQIGSGLSADISVPADGTVNLRDFQVLAGNWLYGTTP